MKYFMTFAYDGSKYFGYQRQPRKKTIQGELEKALKIINNDQVVEVSAAGRTDAGVHALNQKAHFNLEINITLEKLRYALNGLIPKDIYVKKIEEIEDSFHARYNVKAKEYMYKINMGEYNPLEKDYIYQYCKKLDVVAMERAAKYFEGTHDFRSFTKIDEEKDNYVRNVVQVNVIRDMKNINNVIICFLGTGFLRYMVRNMVGFLIEVGEGKRKSEDVIDVLLAKDRQKAGITANPEGLYLKDVLY